MKTTAKRKTSSKTPDGDATGAVLVITGGNDTLTLSEEDLKSKAARISARRLCRSAEPGAVVVHIKKLLSLTGASCQRVLKLVDSFGSSVGIRMLSQSEIHEDLFEGVLSSLKPSLSPQRQSRAQAAALQAAILTHSDQLDRACEAIAAAFAEAGFDHVTENHLLHEAQKLLPEDHPQVIVTPSVATIALDPPLKWHGGKHYAAKWIIAHMPPHVHYVEPYAGGLAVLLAKDPAGVSEVVNDLYGELYTFWAVLRDRVLFEALRRKLEATPFSRQVFHEAEIALPTDDSVMREAKFFVRCRQSRQGLMERFATLSKTRTRREMNEQASSWLTAIDGLPEIHERLKRVVVLNDDALAVIAREDSPATFFYCDPPYLHETRVTTDNYTHEMTRDEHLELLKLLAGISGKFILSGYPNDLYDSFAEKHGWRRIDKEIDCKASGAKTKPKRTESLWMNC